jgi:hypothetical protein
VLLDREKYKSPNQRRMLTLRDSSKQDETKTSELSGERNRSGDNGAIEHSEVYIDEMKWYYTVLIREYISHYHEHIENRDFSSALETGMKLVNALLDVGMHLDATTYARSVIMFERSRLYTSNDKHGINLAIVARTMFNLCESAIALDVKTRGHMKRTKSGHNTASSTLTEMGARGTKVHAPMQLVAVTSTA